MAFSDCKSFISALHHVSQDISELGYYGESLQFVFSSRTYCSVVFLASLTGSQQAESFTANSKTPISRQTKNFRYSWVVSGDAEFVWEVEGAAVHHKLCQDLWSWRKVEDLTSWLDYGHSVEHIR